ncbi:hypothetical protein ABBQ38_010740 [Trebouxia sp. C0009 RCD-2024]
MQLESLLPSFEESLYAISLDAVSASSAGTADGVKLSQAAEWLSLGPHLRGEGHRCTLWQPTGQHSPEKLEEEVIASHGGSWTAADVITRCIGTVSTGAEGWKDNSTSSCLSDTSSNADEQLLELASDSSCLDQGSSAAVEHVEEPTAAHMSANDVADHRALPPPGPQHTAADASKPTRGYSEDVPAWQKWYQMQTRLSLPAAKGVAKGKSRVQQQPCVQSITSAVFPPACLTQPVHHRLGRHSKLHTSVAHVGTLPKGTSTATRLVLKDRRYQDV